MPGPVERWLGTFMCKQYADTFDAYGFKTLQSVSSDRGFFQYGRVLQWCIHFVIRDLNDCFYFRYVSYSYRSFRLWAFLMITVKRF